MSFSFVEVFIFMLLYEALLIDSCDCPSAPSAALIPPFFIFSFACSYSSSEISLF